MDRPEDDRYPTPAPGWAAIDRALQRAHGAEVPHQFASKTAYDLQSPSPLPAVSVYAAQDPAHWHYVSYGLTELFEKSSANPEVSGFGFELTFRLPRGDESVPPAWGVRLLQALGGYVLGGHGSLDSGHLVDLGGPIRPPDAAAEPTRLQGLICVPDPQLSAGGKLQTPHGSLLFLQLYGLTADELQLLEGWDLQRKVGLVREVSALAITEPDRLPMRDDPRRATILRRYELKILI